MSDTQNQLAESVYLLHSGALGDVLLLARFAGSVFPSAKLTVACHAGKGRLLKAVGAVDDYIDIESLPIEKIFRNDCGNCPSLQSVFDGHDRLLSCFGYGDDRIQKSLGALFEKAYFLPVRPCESAFPSGHILDIWADLTGLRPDYQLSRSWFVSRECRNLVSRKLQSLGMSVDSSCDFIAAAVGAGSRDKCWPISSFAEMANKCDWPVVFIAGEVERDRLTKEDFALLNSAGKVVTDLTLEELAGVLSLCSFFVGNDSGPAHLAASLGRPGVVLFGPSNPRVFAPLMPDGSPMRVIRSASGKMDDICVAELV